MYIGANKVYLYSKSLFKNLVNSVFCLEKALGITKGSISRGGRVEQSPVLGA